MSDIEQNPCSFDDIEYEQDVTQFWSSNEDTGEPEVYLDETTDADFRGYVCRGCDDEFDNFEKVKQHLAAAK